MWWPGGFGWFQRVITLHVYAHAWHLGHYLLSQEYKGDCAVFTKEESFDVNSAQASHVSSGSNVFQDRLSLSFPH